MSIELLQKRRVEKIKPERKLILSDKKTYSRLLVANDSTNQQFSGFEQERGKFKDIKNIICHNPHVSKFGFPSVLRILISDNRPIAEGNFNFPAGTQFISLTEFQVKVFPVEEDTFFFLTSDKLRSFLKHGKPDWFIMIQWGTDLFEPPDVTLEINYDEYTEVIE